MGAKGKQFDHYNLEVYKAFNFFFYDGPIKVVSIVKREKEKKPLRCLHLTTKK
jgi:hypothetical protein